MGELLPNEPLIYERTDGVVYARYRDRPDIPRWIVGGDADSVNKARGCLFSYGEWQDMMDLANKNKTLKEQMKQLVTVYYLLKGSKDDLS